MFSILQRQYRPFHLSIGQLIPSFQPYAYPIFDETSEWRINKTRSSGTYHDYAGLTLSPQSEMRSNSDDVLFVDDKR